MKLLEKAENYAAGKMTEVIDKAIAQAYADGYRDGYKDREEEIPVDLRDNKTEYVDLGLPSGTLWSKDYEKDDKDHCEYLPYLKASRLQIPTEEQWNELTTECRWVFEQQNGSYKYICIGPNGNSISFVGKGIFKADGHFENAGKAIFWFKDENDKLDKKSSLIYYWNKIYLETTNYYMGYKLPVRLVKTQIIC